MQSIQATLASPELDDRLQFAAEELDANSPGETEDSWKILLVDDDPEIHHATKVALKFVRFEGRSLSFLSAYSAREAKEHLQVHSDIVLTLLDVVMESDDAGLQLVKYIRSGLNNRFIRIVLRTGQPGQAPEQSVVLDYDINDYKTKLELTQEKLFTTVVASIRGYCDLVALSESQRAIAQLNQTLESRIRDRTAALSQEVEEHQRTEEALKRYLYALTHDLRNPVAGMKTLLESLLMQSDTAGENETAAEAARTVAMPRRLLSRMQLGCDRQLKMINTLLETRDMEIWGVTLDITAIHLGEFVTDILKDYQPQFERKRVTAVLKAADGLTLDDLPLVEGDRTQLWRVFENLLDNALKYNPPGITVTITLSIQSSVNTDEKLAEDDSPKIESFVKCSVRDDGVGIPPTQTETLFELYQRGPGNKTTPGLGLGLYICRRIVEAQGGVISVDSEPSKGSCFWFTLPVARGQAQ